MKIISLLKLVQKIKKIKQKLIVNSNEKKFSGKNGYLILLKIKKKKIKKNAKNKIEIYIKEVNAIDSLDFNNRLNRINFKSESKKEIKKYVIDNRSNKKDGSKYLETKKMQKYLEMLKKF